MIVGAGFKPARNRNSVKYESPWFDFILCARLRLALHLNLGIGLCVDNID